MEENIIQVENLSKSFDISSKEPGLKGTLKHFFKRETKSIEVIKNINKYNYNSKYLEWYNLVGYQILNQRYQN